MSTEAVGAFARNQYRRPGPQKEPLHFPGREPLTARERDVLELFSSGASNKEAGRQLGISPRTIEFHRANVMKKLGARNASDLIRIVLAARRDNLKARKDRWLVFIGGRSRRRIDGDDAICGRLYPTAAVSERSGWSSAQDPDLCSENGQHEASYIVISPSRIAALRPLN